MPATSAPRSSGPPASGGSPCPSAPAPSHHVEQEADVRRTRSCRRQAGGGVKLLEGRALARDCPQPEDRLAGSTTTHGRGRGRTHAGRRGHHQRAHERPATTATTAASRPGHDSPLRSRPGTRRTPGTSILDAQVSTPVFLDDDLTDAGPHSGASRSSSIRARRADVDAHAGFPSARRIASPCATGAGGAGRSSPTARVRHRQHAEDRPQGCGWAPCRRPGSFLHATEVASRPATRSTPTTDRPPASATMTPV